MPPNFRWTTFDVTSQLPEGWQQDIRAIAGEAVFREFPRTPKLSRESADVQGIMRGRVSADQVRKHLPWLYDSYRGFFLDLARASCAEPVAAARDDRYGVVLNTQRGTAMRFECHIDSNPLTGLLFCTDHAMGAGGELVFAQDPDATGIDSVDRDCTVIRPHAGHLIFFDGRYHPHYARALRSATDTRIVAVMNFYTASYPESTRPLELNRHLFGRDLVPQRGASRPGARPGSGRVLARGLPVPRVSLVTRAPPPPSVGPHGARVSPANDIDGASLLLQRQQWSIDVVCAAAFRGPAVHGSARCDGSGG